MKINNFLRIMKKKTDLLTIVFLTIILALYFSFGSYHLGKFVTTDEQLWIYDRIPAYWEGILNNKPKKTHINDKPGVSLALITGPALFFERNPQNHEIADKEVFDSYDTDYTEKLYVLFRLPVFIFNGFFSLFFFWIIKKITSNHWIALWSVAFILLSPVILGISRVVNPDALLWSFSAAAIFSYLAVLKFNQKKFIFLTALFTGLALLTKYVANILFLFYFSVFILNYFLNFKEKFQGKPDASSDYLKKQVKNFWLIFLGSVAIFSLLMPSVFIKINHLYMGTIGFPGFKPFVLPMVIFTILIFLDARFTKSRAISFIAAKLSKIQNYLIKFILGLIIFFIVFALANWITKNSLVDFSHIPIDARSSDSFTSGTNLWEKIMLEIYPVVFSLTPIVLILSLIPWLKIIFKRKEKVSFYSFGIGLFFTMFILGAIFSNLLLTPRYSIMLFPLFGFLASLGLNSLLKKRGGLFSRALVTLAMIIISVISLWRISPFYYNYASELLPKKYIVSSAWGMGGYEAASYLNSLPKAENLIIWTDYRGTCEFFRGKCLFNLIPPQFQNNVDYYVLTRRGQARRDFSTLNFLQSQNKIPVWSLFIDQRPENYLKIFKIKS